MLLLRTPWLEQKAARFTLPTGGSIARQNMASILGVNVDDDDFIRISIFSHSIPDAHKTRMRARRNGILNYDFWLVRGIWQGWLETDEYLRPKRKLRKFFGTLTGKWKVKTVYILTEIPE